MGERRSLKEWFLRSVVLLTGLTIAHFGVTLFLLSDLGSEPFNVLIQGIFRKLSQKFGWTFLTHGRVHIIVCFLIIAILVIIDRTYAKIGTILCMVFGGPVIDFFSFILKPVLGSIRSIPSRLVMLALGCVILAYGTTIAIRSDAGIGPNGLVAVVLSEKLEKPFSVMRLLVDATYTLCGFLLGGTAGIGTLICICLVGPVAGIFLPINGRMVRRFLNHFQLTEQ